MLERTASRSTAFALTAAMWFAGSIVVFIWLAIGQTLSNRVRAHVIGPYMPLGTVPELLPQLSLYATFTAEGHLLGRRTMYSI
ncbi:MAG: hypothetical protein LKJ44_00825 [Bifidobacteriaceae bacterium]|jgi:hypothetical protein|nr:hypothetical protein [Bifidobacteriaceae bacterium]